eukprot:TRINITY_DN5377_c0_g2_i7.p1 TRINITY_DN5377_c0_g2~~TRINITY_DN5377_c0_g2_i7.p1  ORF type:complete len:434 (+),score=48.62 TRINITY_DN5377_c0_g2_i7:61-1302(+)
MCIRDRYQRRVHGNLDRIILSSMLLSLFKGFNAYTEIFVFGVVIKLLLIPTYHSTDFEVHRNWLAITHSLPIDKWYFEATSIWTLDYPPFFAYYEWILSKIAYLVDKKMLIVDNLEYKAPACIYFQRITVIVAEIVFMYCLIRVIRVLTAQTGSERLARNQAFAFFFAFLQVGYILVDSIHFQYNTPLMGLLLLSCSFIIERQYIKGSLVYAILLNFKHIYIYASLVIFVFYLSRVCFDDKWRFKFMSFVKVGISVAGVFVLSLLAFLNASENTRKKSPNLHLNPTQPSWHKFSSDFSPSKEVSFTNTGPLTSGLLISSLTKFYLPCVVSQSGVKRAGILMQMWINYLTFRLRRLCFSLSSLLYLSSTKSGDIEIRQEYSNTVLQEHSSFTCWASMFTRKQSSFLYPCSKLHL